MNDLKLPPGWRLAELGDVARVFAGCAAPQGSKYFSKDGPLFVRAADLGTHGRTMALEATNDRLSDAGLALKGLVRAKAGTTLFPKSGAAVATNNRALLATDAYFVSHLMAVEPGPELDPRWAYYWLTGIDMRAYSDNDAYPSVKQSVASRIPILVPPLKEQRRITDRLETAMQEIAAARRATDEALDLAAKIRGAIFSELIGAGDWPVRSLIEVCDGKGQYGLSVKAHREPRGYPMLRMGNIQDGTLDLRDLTYVELEHGDYERYRIRSGDVLFNRTNSAELVGKTAYVDTEVEAVFASYIVRFRPRQDVADGRYLAQLINSPLGRNFIEREMGRAVGQVNISAGKMHHFALPLPPLHEQRRIMEQVTTVTNAASAAAKSMKEQSMDLAALPASLLSAACRGEL